MLFRFTKLNATGVGRSASFPGLTFGNQKWLQVMYRASLDVSHFCQQICWQIARQNLFQRHRFHWMQLVHVWSFLFAIGQTFFFRLEHFSIWWCPCCNMRVSKKTTSYNFEIHLSSLCWWAFSKPFQLGPLIFGHTDTSVSRPLQHRSPFAVNSFDCAYQVQLRRFGRGRGAVL